MSNFKKKNVLILVEGEKTDVKVMEKLFEIYHISHEFEIISYKTNIYTLYKRIFDDIYDPDGNDLIQVLKEREKSESKRSILDKKFTDILLIFDLDPHDPEFEKEKIIKMQQHFCESTDMGKLYLNYPMIEAFYHMKTIPDKEYLNREVSLTELKSKKYKQRVQGESKGKDYRKFAVDKNEFNEIIFQNIQKAMFLIDENLVEDRKILISNFIDHLKVLEKQMEFYENEEIIKVLCTCVFHIIDYNPKLVL